VQSKAIKDKVDESKAMRMFQILKDEFNMDLNVKGKDCQTPLHLLANAE